MRKSDLKQIADTLEGTLRAYKNEGWSVTNSRTCQDIIESLAPIYKALNRLYKYDDSVKRYTFKSQMS